MSEGRTIFWTPIFNDTDDDGDPFDENTKGEDEEGFKESGQPLGQVIHAFEVPSLITTPFGTFRSDSQFNPLNDRDCFVANTNFELMISDVNTIAKTPGVEALRIISRYSFAVMVGVLFDADVVLSTVEAKLDCEEDFGEEEFEELSEIEQKIIDDAPDDGYWITYLFPNGKVYTETYEDMKNLEKAKFKFFELEKLSAGRIFCSEKINEDSE